MAIGTWTLDITDGVLKNHALSSEILRAAYESCRAMDFVKTVPFGKNKGESVTVPRIHAIAEPDDATLEELMSIPEDSYTITGTKITVAELARTLPYTSLQDELLVFDLENELQGLLREQIKLVLDSLAITAFKLAKNWVTPTSSTACSYGTGGVPPGTIGSDLNAYIVEEVIKFLVENLYAPPYDEDYVCLARYKGLLNMRRDPAATGLTWQDWHKYTDPEAKYNGEMGRFERCRFIETNHSRALANVGNYCQSIFFGKDAVAMAETVSPELRAGIPSDLGRKKLVGWYAILGMNIRWDTANPREARVVVVS